MVEATDVSQGRASAANVREAGYVKSVPPRIESARRGKGDWCWKKRTAGATEGGWRSGRWMRGVGCSVASAWGGRVVPACTAGVGHMVEMKLKDVKELGESAHS